MTNINMKLRQTILVCALVVAGSKLLAQETSTKTQPVNIKQAIDIALANNYGLRADSLNIASTAFKNDEVTGYYLPQVNYSNKFNYNAAIPSQMLPGAVLGDPSKEYVPVQFGTKYDASTSIEMTQNIYRKDLLIKMRAAGLNNAIAQTKYRISREDLIYQVAGAFYALQSNAELIRTTSSDYENLKKVLSIAKAQFDNGTLKRIDYESLEINVANKKSQLNQLQTQYNEQQNYFKYLLGIPMSAQLTISESIAAAPKLMMPDDNSVMKREDIILYHQLIKSKEVEMKAIRAEKSPAVATYFKYGYQSQFGSTDKMFDKDYWYKSSTFGITTSISLFDGNRRKSRIHVAQTEMEQLKWQSEQKQQKAQTELLSAWQTLSNNLDQYEVNEKNLALAERVFNSRTALYTEGVTTLVELLDAEGELTQARNLYIQSVIDVQTGILDLHKANGTLTNEFLQSL
jgi:outer membrane protein